MSGVEMSFTVAATPVRGLRPLPSRSAKPMPAARRATRAAATEKFADMLQLAAAPTEQLAAAAQRVPTVTPGQASGAVDQAVANAIDLIKAAGKLAEGGIDNLTTGSQYAKQAYDRASPYINNAASTATPYLKSGAKTATDLAQPALRQIEPLLQGGVGEVERFLSAQGLNAQALTANARQAQDVAGDAYVQSQPFVIRAYNTVSATQPGILAKYAVGLVAVYYLGPSLLKVLFRAVRGYRGGITPAAALDSVCNEGNTVLVDIRTEREKGTSGVPDIPNSGRLVSVEYASIADRKLRGQLRNAGDIERQVTVLEIASLKRVGKGTKLLILDSNGGGAKDIAKGLSARGFRNVFVIQGGYSGWTSSKLQTKNSSSVSDVQILGPLFGTGKANNNGRTQRGQRALPSGR